MCSSAWFWLAEPKAVAFLYIRVRSDILNENKDNAMHLQDIQYMIR